MRRLIIIGGTIIAGLVLNQLAWSYLTGVIVLAVSVAIGAVVLYAIQKVSSSL